MEQKINSNKTGGMNLSVEFNHICSKHPTIGLVELTYNTNLSCDEAGHWLLVGGESELVDVGAFGDELALAGR